MIFIRNVKCGRERDFHWEGKEEKENGWLDVIRSVNLQWPHDFNWLRFSCRRFVCKIILDASQCMASSKIYITVRGVLRFLSILSKTSVNNSCQLLHLSKGSLQQLEEENAAAPRLWLRFSTRQCETVLFYLCSDKVYPSASCSDKTHEMENVPPGSQLTSVASVCGITYRLLTVIPLKSG